MFKIERRANTLAIARELHLHDVEMINIDQSSKFPRKVMAYDDTKFPKCRKSRQVKEGICELATH